MSFADGCVRRPRAQSWQWRGGKTYLSALRPPRLVSVGQQPVRVARWTRRLASIVWKQIPLSRSNSASVCKMHYLCNCVNIGAEYIRIRWECPTRFASFNVCSFVCIAIVCVARVSFLPMFSIVSFFTAKTTPFATIAGTTSPATQAWAASPAPAAAVMNSLSVGGSTRGARASPIGTRPARM